MLGWHRCSGKFDSDARRAGEYWEASGIPFRELIDKLIELGLKMHAEKGRTKYQIEFPVGSGDTLEA